MLRTKPESAACAAAAAGLLRQLAGSDAVKSQIVACGGLQALTTTLQSHANSPAALEQALGLATAVTLRAPAIADAAIAAGIPAAVLEVRSAISREGFACNRLSSPLMVVAPFLLLGTTFLPITPPPLYDGKGFLGI